MKPTAAYVGVCITQLRFLERKLSVGLCCKQ